MEGVLTEVWEEGGNAKIIFGKVYITVLVVFKSFKKQKPL